MCARDVSCRVVELAALPALGVVLVVVRLTFALQDVTFMIATAAEADLPDAHPLRRAARLHR